jgi:GNAT superfamily N-acetyltransferase
VAELTYRRDTRPPASTVAELYKAAGLNRPVHDLDRLQRVYDGSTVVVTAWEGQRLVGILRGWSDGAYDGYVCDLAVHPDHQRRGVGRALLDACAEGNPEVQWVLRASLVATHYYEHLGWARIENGWYLARQR